MEASQAGHYNIVKLLADNAADVNVTDEVVAAPGCSTKGDEGGRVS